MAKDCIDILKDASPQLHKYLEGKAGVYDRSAASKQAYRKAASELQNETLNNLQNVYNKIGLKGFEPIEAQQPKVVPGFATGEIDREIENTKAAIESAKMDENFQFEGVGIKQLNEDLKTLQKEPAEYFSRRINELMTDIQNLDVKSNEWRQTQDLINTYQKIYDDLTGNKEQVGGVSEISPQPQQPEVVSNEVKIKKDLSTNLKEKGFVVSSKGGLEKNGVNIAFRTNSVLGVDKQGDVFNVDSPRSTDVVLQEIKIVDEAVRGKGNATQVLKEFLNAADQEGKTIYIEPEPIAKYKNKKNITREQLINWYEKNGFEKKNDYVWVRKPKEIEANEQNKPTQVSVKTEVTQPDTTEVGKTGGQTEKGTAFSQKARTLAAAIRTGGLRAALPDWAKADLPEGTQQAGFGGKSLDEAVARAIELVADAVDGGKAIADAIKQGFAHLKDYYTKNTKSFDEKKVSREFTANMNALFDGEPPKGGTEQQTTTDDQGGQRRFSKQVLADEEILPGVKRGVEANLEYARQTNVMSVAEASEILDRIGIDEAYNLVVNNGDVKPAVRVVLGETLIKKYNDLAKQAAKKGDTELENFYTNKTIDVANFVSEKLGTEGGQMIQAFSLYSRLSPEAQLLAATKEVKQQAAGRKNKSKKDVNSIGDKLQKANEDAADQITSSKKFRERVEKTENTRVKKAKDKVQKAKDTRKRLLDRYKGKKGGGLTLSSGGLTSEGIEFIGGLVKTYIDEGLANLELISVKVLQHLKDITGKANIDEVRRDVNSIISDQLFEQSNKKIVKGLSELETAISKIVKEHYSVAESAKTSLVSKFVDQLGLEKSEAEELANQINEEFDKIVTRKKEQILYNEKKRFDRIRNQLDPKGKKAAKTLAEDIVKYSNLGAFDNAQFMEFLAAKLDVGKLTPEEAKQIRILAERIQSAPEGSPKNDATQDLLKYRANMNGISWGETVQAVWYANILSGYATHLRNTTSNFFNGMLYFASEAVRDPRSIPILVYGGARGVKRGMYEAWHTLTTGRSPIHISKVEIPGTFERQKFIGGYFNPYNWLKFVGRLMVAEDVLQFQALKEMRATQLAYKEAKKMGFKDPFGKATWRVINEKLLNTKQRSDEAFLQAEEEGFKKGSVEWKRRVYEVMENSRPIRMTEDAYGFAAKGTFNHTPEGTLGALTNAISAALDIQFGGVRPLRFFVPFTRIITNVANNALDFGPVGLIRAARGKRGFESFKGSQYGKSAYHEMTPEERRQAVAKASLGIALTGAMYALTKVPCKGGNNVLEITGGGTGNFAHDAQLKQSGWQPFSIRVCGGAYLSYKYTPLIFNLGFVGNIEDHEKFGTADGSLAKKIMMAAYQTGQLALDGTWVGSTSDIMKTIAESDPSQLAKNLERTLSNMANQAVIPNAYTQGAQQIEEIMKLPQKDAKGLWERMIQHIPIARNSLNDKINALGEPIITDVDIFISEPKPHKQWDYLNSKQVWVAPVNKNSMIVFDQTTGEERPITKDEYYEFSKLRGANIKEDVDRIIENGVNIEGPEGEQQKTAQELTTPELKKLMTVITGNATKKAKAELFGVAEKEEKVIMEIIEY